MNSFKQRLYNMIYRLVLRPLALLDGKSSTKRFLVTNGSYFLASKPIQMRTEPFTLQTQKRQIDLLKCTQGPVSTDIQILYFHGGGFGTGSPKSHQHIATRLAGLAKGTAWMPDYPLSPENRFPAAIEYGYDAYLALLATGIAPKNIIIAGDSAGGNICAALLQFIERDHKPMPAGVILFSPDLDFTHQNQSHVTNLASEKLLSPRLFKIMSENYLGDHDPHDPLASPIFATYQNPPPMLIFTSRDEVLYGDAFDFTLKLKSAGHDVTLIEEENLPHAWPMLWGKTKDADRSLPICEAFIKRICTEKFY